jgi:hypothetical protein
MSNNTGRLVLVATVFLLPCTQLAQLRGNTVQEKNLVPALYTFSECAGALGLFYGIDPITPDITMQGTFNNTGFGWQSSGQYHGSPFSWSVTGTYDAGTDKTNWTGAGTYEGLEWTMSGSCQWPTEIDFLYTSDLLADSEYELVTAEPVAGTLTSVNPITTGGNTIKIKVNFSKHQKRILKIIPVKSEDVPDDVEVSTTEGTVTKAEVNFNGGTSKASVNGKGGEVSSSAGTMELTVQVVPPEPASVLFVALGSLAMIRRRRH